MKGSSAVPFRSPPPIIKPTVIEEIASPYSPSLEEILDKDYKKKKEALREGFIKNQAEITSGISTTTSPEQYHPLPGFQQLVQVNLSPPILQRVIEEKEYQNENNKSISRLSSSKVEEEDVPENHQKFSSTFFVIEGYEQYSEMGGSYVTMQGKIQMFRISDADIVLPRMNSTEVS